MPTNNTITTIPLLPKEKRLQNYFVTPTDLSEWLPRKCMRSDCMLNLAPFPEKVEKSGEKWGKSGKKVGKK